MAVTTTPSVSYPTHTSKGTGVTQVPSVSIFSTVSADQLLLLTGGNLLLMSGGDWMQVQ